MTERKIKKAIYQMLRPLILTPDIHSQLRGNENEDQLLELEFKYFFESYDHKKPIYKVKILNNLKVEAGIIYDSRPICEYCKFEHSDDCDFSFADGSVTMKQILKM